MMDKQGWKCGQCHRTMAPWIPFCDCSGKVTIGSSSETSNIKLKCNYCGELYPAAPFYAHVCGSGHVCVSGKDV